MRRAVIVHELVHLKLRNGAHGKLFRALVQAYLEGASQPSRPRPTMPLWAPASTGFTPPAWPGGTASSWPLPSPSSECFTPFPPFFPP
ncbi:DUF45 domain-containing protein [Thermus thermophilus]|uniref:DUF45 domain-containing protein n=1 Tax=Thermus thermophilus TaxID=274 RepID=UPI001F54B427|nr:DUF45 domain-containing protein [Thermus thermophilus]WMV94874.1 hypothetical protein RB649_07320 [Thermus thermophilus HB27]